MTAAVLAIVAPAGAATNVATCTPSIGLSSVSTIKPAAPTSGDAAYALKLSTTVDGCVANAAQLALWDPSKNGTPDGASIAKAKVTLSTKGFGNCTFNLNGGDASNYPAVGTMLVKWLTSAGDSIKSAKTTSAFVKVSADLNTFSATADGIVTKGLGVGANLHASSGIDTTNLNNYPFFYCVFATPVLPVSEIDLINNGTDTLSIDFP
jgi:hypothetical protein